MAIRPAYARRRPERTTLYRVLLENIETLYSASDEGALPFPLPHFVRKELDGYLDCGLLVRGFAHVACEHCARSHLVAFSCKRRGFCPSCMGRRMAETAANLIEYVLPPAPLRQWVLTLPYAWRKRVAYDGALLGLLTRIFVKTVLAFYRKRIHRKGESGAVVVVQRTSSDLRLNPHLHIVFLDGVYRELGSEVVFEPLEHLATSEVGEVLEKACRRLERGLRRRGLLAREDEEEEENPSGELLAALAASAVAGTPPTGPTFLRKLPRLVSSKTSFEGKLCVQHGDFTLHARTRAGAMDTKGREALLRYILRPIIAQERVTEGPEGLVRITLKRPFSDGTVAVDMDPLSLLTRLCAAVPPPRVHTVRYAGVLAARSKLRARIVPKPGVDVTGSEVEDVERATSRCRYWHWGELLKRTFDIDLRCESCGEPMKLVALVREEESVVRFLRALSEPTEPPRREPARGPPWWRSSAVRRLSQSDA